MATKQLNDVSVLWVAGSNFPAKTGIKIHNHDYYHLFYLREGEATFQVGEKTYTIHPGESILAKKNVNHGLKPINEKAVRCFEVKFTALDSTTVRMLDSIPIHIPKDNFITQLLQILVDESVLGAPSSPAFTANYLITTINYLYRKFAKTEIGDSTIIETSGLSDLSKKILKYLETNFNKDINLQMIADEIDLNKNYMCSAFKRDTNMTIGNCLMLIRVHKSAELISYSDMSLSQVASNTGFTNISHFNRVFKKIVGIPPGQYRKMFSADMLFPANLEILPEHAQYNGFIVSVLARKKLSTSDILLLEGILDEESTEKLKSAIETQNDDI